MDMQCYQCRTVTADPDLTAVSGVLLCPACKDKPSTAVRVYAMLVGTYAPDVHMQVRDMVAGLESERDALKAERDFAESVINNVRRILNGVDSWFTEATALRTQPTILGSQAERVVNRLLAAELERDALRAENGRMRELLAEWGEDGR